MKDKIDLNDVVEVIDLSELPDNLDLSCLKIARMQNGKIIETSIADSDNDELLALFASGVSDFGKVKKMYFLLDAMRDEIIKRMGQNAPTPDPSLDDSPSQPKDDIH